MYAIININYKIFMIKKKAPREILVSLLMEIVMYCYYPRVKVLLFRCISDIFQNASTHTEYPVQLVHGILQPRECGCASDHFGENTTNTPEG